MMKRYGRSAGPAQHIVVINKLNIMQPTHRLTHLIDAFVGFGLAPVPIKQSKAKQQPEINAFQFRCAFATCFLCNLPMLCSAPPNPRDLVIINIKAMPS